MTVGQKKTLQFLKKYARDILPALENTNIFIATAVAQKCLESGFGTSELATRYNNFGGIKGRATYSTGVTSNGWAKFASPLDSFRSYSYFITTKRRTNGQLWYKTALESKNPEDQIFNMVASGYCTYPNMTLEQGARFYLSKCKNFVSILNQEGIGGKVGTGGTALSTLLGNISNIS